MTITCRLTAAGKTANGHIFAEFSFAEYGVGFGQIVIRVDDKGQHFIDDEYMGAERASDLICAVFNDAILASDQDPERRRAFDEATGRGGASE